MAEWCVDFDGTIVKHEYPRIGEPVPGALGTLRKMRSKGIKIILFTMRSGDELQEAIKYLNSNGVQLYGININPTQRKWTDSPKAYGQVYIDDAAFGCPLIHPEEGRPYVDWKPISKEIDNLYPDR